MKASFPVFRFPRFNWPALHLQVKIAGQLHILLRPVIALIVLNDKAVLFYFPGLPFELQEQPLHRFVIFGLYFRLPGAVQVIVFRQLLEPQPLNVG